MSDQITTARAEQFQARVQHLLQQKASRLRRAVMEQKYTGSKRQVAVDQVGLVTAVQKAGRHADLPTVEVPHARRWVTPITYEFRDFVDSPDQMRMLWDPRSEYAKSFASALGRAMDEAIVSAFFGTSVTGEDASGTETFDTTNFSIANGGVDLTVAKLLTAREKLMGAENDPDDDYFIAVTSKQFESLLNETQLTSGDYNTVKALVEGSIGKFVGFTFIHCERVGLSGTDRAVPAWVRSGIHLGVLNDIRTPIDWLPEKQAWQIAGVADFGATRTQQGKVVRILCTES